MKVGLFFGSFNPVHIGHLILANHILEYSDIDELWFVITPRSPFKKNESLADDYQRLHMVNLAIDEYEHMRTSKVEFDMPQPNYTVHTLAKLREDYPQHSFTLIMGEDNLTHLHKWKNAAYLVENYDILVYPRLHKSKKKPKVSMDRITMVDAPIIEISSTAIRQAYKDGKNTKPLLPNKVYTYLDGSNLYL
ncbi:MAG: nicotinate (nicotinamide) nucleotide adenylyltransferase [Weeksellaceae bacterium]